MSRADRRICFAEAEKRVSDRLYLYWEIRKALDMEKEERFLSSFCSTLGKNKTRTNKVGNPTLNQFLRMGDPIKDIELPDVEIVEEYQEKGEKKARLKKIPGVLIQDPVKWIRLIDSLRDLFRGTQEGEILEFFFLQRKKLSEISFSLKITKSQVRMGISKILGVGIGLALMGDLR